MTRRTSFQTSQSLVGIPWNTLKLLRDFLYFWQTTSSSSLENVNTRVLQGSIFGPLLVLIYIKDLSNRVSSNYKLFAYSTSLFQ